MSRIINNRAACFLLCLFFFLISNLKAQQVEHNYPIGPQMTDCDSIVLHELGAEKAIAKVRAAKYRFHNNFRLTRKTGFQGGEYYSCDNQTGFLIIKNNNTELLYLDVDKSIWEELISSNDPEGYYGNIEKELHIFSDPE